jgi:hypothetical protein
MPGVAGVAILVLELSVLFFGFTRWSRRLSQLPTLSVRASGSMPGIPPRSRV